ncbi:MAG: DNA-3-methyladenine glycosylase I [Candidatus Krumholzibacteriia bacterium]
MKTRCRWAGDDPLMVSYHDEEWGVPQHDDRRLFEFLILEGAQAGLSWSTILRKRENYRAALAGFDPEELARLTDAGQRRLLQDPGIVRNKLKIASVKVNARAFLDVRRECGSFDDYVWQFVGRKPVQNRWRNLSQIPASTPQSEAMSKDLKKRGFKFVGPTICYAFMQAVGMVNDHTKDCFRHRQVRGDGGA